MRRSVCPSFPLVCLAYTLDQEHSLPLPRLGMHQGSLLTVGVFRSVEIFHLTSHLRFSGQVKSTSFFRHRRFDIRPSGVRQRDCCWKRRL
jgi:hypothetical protein